MPTPEGQNACRAVASRLALCVPSSAHFKGEQKVKCDRVTALSEGDVLLDHRLHSPGLLLPSLRQSYTNLAHSYVQPPHTITRIHDSGLDSRWVGS